MWDYKTINIYFYYFSRTNKETAFQSIIVVIVATKLTQNNTD